MSQKARAVICRALDQPVVVEDIVVEAPRRNEVMIKLSACGVCHSDLSATNGTIAFPPPLVLGHEGAGIVVQVGEGVQLHGGMGMTDAFDLGLFMKRARALQELFGDAHFHADRFATLGSY